MNEIEILINGNQGAGKTRLMHEIGSILKERGFNVTCFDEGREIRPISDKSLITDDRVIRIKTLL